MTKAIADYKTGRARVARDLPRNVRLPHATWALLQEIAAAQGRSVSELIRLLIERSVPFARDLPPKDTAGLLHPRRRPAA